MVFVERALPIVEERLASLRRPGNQLPFIGNAQVEAETHASVDKPTLRFLIYWPAWSRQGCDVDGSVLLCFAFLLPMRTVTSSQRCLSFHVGRLAYSLAATLQ